MWGTGMIWDLAPVSPFNTYLAVRGTRSRRNVLQKVPYPKVRYTEQCRMHHFLDGVTVNLFLTNILLKLHDNKKKHWAPKSTSAEREE